MLSLSKLFFGSPNDRTLKQAQRVVEKVNACEEAAQRLSDAELAGRTAWFRERLEGGESLDKLLPEAFATVREASLRVLGLRHFDAQIIGGLVLHQGRIAEMKTGEGKTLVATLAVYLNALTGKGVHVVTVNDYLAHRDAEWMGKLYNFLGLSVGVLVHGIGEQARRAAYAADITYGTNNEFGFDYLRDNMKYSREEMVQRPFHYAIVDEVDSILIDEARTPLIISGPTEDNSALYVQINTLMNALEEGDYEKDEKSNAVALTEEGVEHMEALLCQEGLMEEGESLYDMRHVALVHHVNQALRAHMMFTRDVDYIVKDKRVVIIDEFTGRMMEGRRYSEGLHQALEAKEDVPIQNENQTLASVTFQNYFRQYPKLAGMTGTAATEAEEFGDIYGLAVVEIPTHRPVARMDADDEIYRTGEEKYDAILKQIRECYEKQQPVLVGTISIEKSEFLSKRLKEEKVTHQVLNARHHAQEAHIIAQAGRAGAVTIATNMAGRGTDIMLGGNPAMRIADELGGEAGEAVDEAAAQRIREEVAAEKQQVLEAGGLYVIGTERHESRRIDNQLRGRSGRQGDPGGSKFFISLEDDLMRIFGSERMDSLLQRLGMEEGEAITHPWMTRALEKAQKRVESRNYDIRKNLLKFDDVMNDQRQIVYEQRIELMETEEIADMAADFREAVVSRMVSAHIPPKVYPEQWDLEGLEKEVFRVLALHLPVQEWGEEDGIAELEIFDRISKAADKLMADKEELYGETLLHMAERRIILQALDQLWKDHLYLLDQLRQSIGLRASGQRDPLQEYKREAFTYFEQMLDQLQEVTTQRLCHLQITVELPEEMAVPKAFNPETMRENRRDEVIADGLGRLTPEPGARPVVVAPRRAVPADQRDPYDPATWGKISRNELCPCGSGKKYKHCHGML